MDPTDGKPAEQGAAPEHPVAGPPQALAATTVFARLIHRRT